jgi:4-amino-4-deoxy-L-arabinose transferase-like glycosyltransferase
VSPIDLDRPPTVSCRSWRTAAGLAACVAVALLLRWPIADIPLERDEGEYGYIARRWMAGVPPYRSAFDQKPPGVFAVYAVILSVFGSSPAAIHWGAQVYTLGTLGLIYFAGRRLFGSTAGVAAALFAAYMTADRCVLGNAANTELFMILPLTAGFLAVVRATDGASAGWATAGGVCGALALLFKQVALPNVAVYGLLLLGAARQRFRLIVVYTLAMLAALTATVVLFAAAGVRDEFLDGVLIHNLGYANQVAWYDYPRAFLKTFEVVALQWWPILVLAMAACLRPVSVPMRWGPRWLAGIWLLSSFSGVAVGGYFREHYYMQLIPPLAVLAGRGAALLAGRLSPARPQAVAGVIVAAAIGYGVLVMPGYWLTGTPADKCRLLYDIAPFPEAVPVGDYLARHADADTIFVYGNEPEIYFYSGRRAASRYIFLYPLLTPAPGVDARQVSALAELAERRPRYIVVHRCVYPPVGGSPPKDFEVGLADLLVRDYRQVGAVGPDDRAVRPVDGPPAGTDVLRPAVEETLAVWQRKD